MPYQIIRFYEDYAMPSEVIKTVQSWDEVQHHCASSKSSSATATDPEGVTRTQQVGHWFDGWREI